MQTLKDIDNGRSFDWGRASEDYAKYRDIYPEEFYNKMISLGLCTQGQHVLDLGTGTGVLPRNMYKYGASFVGVDIAENQIEAAKQMSKGMDIEYIVSSAEGIDFPDNSFDTITACQCFMYFDKKIVIPKFHRILKENGHFAILFMAWLPNDSEIAARSEELVLKYNPNWNGAHLAPDKEKRRDMSEITPDWTQGLFKTEKWIEYEINLNFTRESWHGRMRACRGIGASTLSAEDIAAWEKEHLGYLKTMPESFDIPHWITILNLRKV